MEKVTSREYKITLNVDEKLFQDWDRCGFEHLLKIVKFAALQARVKCSGKFKPFNKFIVQYNDTPNLDLYKNGWIFRKRKYRDEETYPYEYTLKYRSPDRYLSATKDISPSSTFINNKSMNVYHKFEEDITLDPHKSNYSPSTNIYIKHSFPFKKFGTLLSVFPGLKQLKVGDETPLFGVQGKKVIQEVWKGVTMKLGESDIKLKIVLWWDIVPSERKERKTPNLLFGELMFRLKSSKEKYPKKTIIDAHKFYYKLNDIGINTGWVNTHGVTKTKYFYGAGASL
jgi:hypothetical protein